MLQSSTQTPHTKAPTVSVNAVTKREDGKYTADVTETHSTSTVKRTFNVSIVEPPLRTEQDFRVGYIMTVV